MNCTGSKVGREGDEAAIIRDAYLTIDSITAILATAGNLFCLCVIRAIPDTDVHDGTKVFMLAQTSTDLLLGVFCVTDFVLRHVVGIHGNIYICKAISVSETALMIISIFILIMIGFDRYVAIIRPLRYPALLTKKRTIIATVSVATFTITFVASFSITNEVVYCEDLQVCLRLGFTMKCTASTIILSLFVLFPLLILAIIYVKLMLISRRHALRIQQQPIQADYRRDESHSAPPVRPHAPTVRPFAHPRVFAGSKALRMFLAVNITYILHWLPIYMNNIYGCYNDEHYTPTALFVLAHITYRSSSWVNPVIYTISNKMFRKNAVKLLRKCQRYNN